MCRPAEGDGSVLRCSGPVGGSGLWRAVDLCPTVCRPRRWLRLTPHLQWVVRREADAEAAGKKRRQRVAVVVKEERVVGQRRHAQADLGDVVQVKHQPGKGVHGSSVNVTLSECPLKTSVCPMGEKKRGGGRQEKGAWEGEKARAM
eukprot:331392-Chlamydomonas_euryale.AAC.23